jgi:hypothetical protein
MGTGANAGERISSRAAERPLLGGARTEWVALMNEASDSAEAFPANTCQGCGSSDVQHRSLLRMGEDKESRLVLLCENCHRERIGSEG